MIKVEIVKKISETLHMKDREALVVVDSVIEALKKIVSEQGRLEIRDFGVFQAKTRKERVGRNPKDKKEYPIPPRRVVTFKMGRELKVSGEALHALLRAGKSASAAESIGAEAPMAPSQPAVQQSPLL